MQFFADTLRVKILPASHSEIPPWRLASARSYFPLRPLPNSDFRKRMHLFCLPTLLSGIWHARWQLATKQDPILKNSRTCKCYIIYPASTQYQATIGPPGKRLLNGVLLAGCMVARFWLMKSFPTIHNRYCWHADCSPLLDDELVSCHSHQKPFVSHLSVCFIRLICKHFGPRSDCSLRSSLISVHSGNASNDKSGLESRHLNMCSRRNFKLAPFSKQKIMGRIRVNCSLKVVLKIYSLQQWSIEPFSQQQNIQILLALLLMIWCFVKTYVFYVFSGGPHSVDDRLNVFTLWNIVNK